MMKKFLRIVPILAILLSALLPFSTSPKVAEAASYTLYENNASNNNSDSTAIYGDIWVAQQFTTSSTVAHSEIQIDLLLKRTGTTAGNVTVTLREVDTATDLPTGSDLVLAQTSSNSFQTTYGWQEFLFTEMRLEVNTKYAIVVRAATGTSANYVQWADNTTGNLANAVGSHSTDGGATWTSDTPIDYLFKVWGDPSITIESVNVFTNYVTTGDMLFAVEYTNLIAPYYPYATISNYFYLQLLGTDNTTILASSPLLAWGDSPASIYLSDASAITFGGAYSIRIYEGVSPNVAVYHTMVSSDWKGSDLGLLYRWAIVTAHHIEVYLTALAGESVSLTTYVAQPVSQGGMKEVLNDHGTVIFLVGIPSFQTQQPGTFNSTVEEANTIKTTYTESYRTGILWQDEMGSTVVAYAQAVADLFSTDVKTGMTALWILGSLIICSLALLAGGGLNSFLFLMSISLMGAVYLKILAFVWIIIIVFFALLFIVKVTWLDK